MRRVRLSDSGAASTAGVSLPGGLVRQRVLVQHRKCLLVTHAETLFCASAPAVRAASLRPWAPSWAVELIAKQLRQARG